VSGLAAYWVPLCLVASEGQDNLHSTQRPLSVDAARHTHGKKWWNESMTKY